MTQYRLALLLGLGFFWTQAMYSQGQDGLFRGPDILSRGTRPIGRSGGRPITLRANLTFGTAYYGGLTRAGLEQDLRPGDEATYSGNFGFGVAGTRVTPKSSSSGQYQGFMNLFGNRVTFTGVNQRGQFTYGRQIARRWSAFVLASGMTQSTVLNGLSPLSFDENLLGDFAAPQAEAFDTRTVQLQGGAGLTYQKSARMTFSMVGGGMAQRRKASALVGNNAFNANGTMNYQLTRRTGVGANYSYLTSYHQRQFGEAYSHTYMGTFSRVLTNRWSMGIGLGAMRMEAERLRRVAVDPLITALTGQTSAVQAFHNVFWGLAAQAALNGSYRTSHIAISYNRGANPGNGFILSGQREQAIAQYSYSGIRRTTLSAYAARARFLPVLGAFDVNRFTSVGGGGSAGYRLTGSLHLTGGAQLVRNTAGSISALDRTRYILSVGLSFQPGEVPLVLW